jgi:chromosome segregation ATPase
MFRAIGRYLRALGYAVTGRLDKARESLNKSPAVIRASYAEIIREKSERVREYRNAVAGLVTQEEKKKSQINQLSQDIQHLENLKTGALAKAKKRAAQLQASGRSADDIHHDEDYIKCKSAFSDFSSTQNEKQQRVEEQETDVKDYATKISNHKLRLQSLLRELEKLRTEADEAVADIVTAQEEKDIADMLTGISVDGSNEQLAEMRDLRHKVKAEARIASELSGTDTQSQEAEFLEYARHTESSSEFDSLIGLAEKVDDQTQKDTTPKDKELLPQ